MLKDISFTTVVGKNKDMFAFIQKDESLNFINCHLFRCAGERAFDITTAVGEAFKAFAEEQKRTGGNPFQPYGEREAPTGEMFHRQVHRRDLAAIKPIGAGQFGQVRFHPLFYSLAVRLCVYLRVSPSPSLVVSVCGC